MGVRFYVLCSHLRRGAGGYRPVELRGPRDVALGRVLSREPPRRRVAPLARALALVSLREQRHAAARHLREEPPAPLDTRPLTARRCPK